MHTYSAWRQQSMKRVELIPGRNPMWFGRAGMKIFRPFALTAASKRLAVNYEGKFDITSGNLSQLTTMFREIDMNPSTQTIC